MAVRKEFRVHRLNTEGLAKCDALAEAFSRLLDTIDELAPAPSREKALAVTALETAAFNAKRCIASDPVNHG
jgi:hypothetical protein